MKTLIIHHVEFQWENALRERGYELEGCCMKIAAYLNENDFSRVILTRMEDTKLQMCHHVSGLDLHISDVEEYGYGWDRDMIDVDKELEANGERFVEGGQHSDLVWVPGWLENLQKEIHLCGCFDGECIEDMEIAAAGKKVVRIEHLIV
jgi:hypothetical protein